MDNTFDISIVRPVYKAEKMLDKLVFEIQKTVESLGLTYEIILIDDRSPDGSWEKMKSISKSVKEVKSVRLSRNFGQHPAIMAGLSLTKGDWVVVMDCDLQDQPTEIIKLYKKAQEGFDVVLGQRRDRKDSFIKKISSRVFYSTLSYLSGIKQDESIANFGIYNKKVINQINNMVEPIRYFPSQIKWVGFNSVSIPIEHAPRNEGNSNYNYSKLLKLALDIILAYSDKPLRLTLNFGLIISILSFLTGVIYLVQYYLGNILVSGFTTIVIAICFFSGIIISILGILGLYIGKIFEGIKRRPIYIIDK